MIQPSKCFQNGRIIIIPLLDASDCFLNNGIVLRILLERSNIEIPNFYIYYQYWRNGQIPVAIINDLQIKKGETIIDILDKFPNLYIVDYRKYKEATFNQEYKALIREQRGIKAGMVLGTILYIIAILLIHKLIKIGAHFIVRVTKYYY